VDPRAALAAVLRALLALDDAAADAALVAALREAGGTAPEALVERVRALATALRAQLG
jgi:hypothetical protein